MLHIRVHLFFTKSGQLWSLNVRFYNRIRNDVLLLFCRSMSCCPTEGMIMPTYRSRFVLLARSHRAHCRPSKWWTSSGEGTLVLLAAVIGKQLWTIFAFVVNVAFLLSFGLLAAVSRKKLSTIFASFVIVALLLSFVLLAAVSRNKLNNLYFICDCSFTPYFSFTSSCGRKETEQSLLHLWL